jgi:hypothetical protein
VGNADLALEVERLRTLLERQPSCLMRVGVDGLVLAASDAAIGLLGAQKLAQVLDASLVQRLHGNGAQVWADFVSRVQQSGSASAECEMRDLAGVQREVVLQGVSLPPHSDGVDSLMLVVRDVSTARRLEASLREQQELRRVAQDDLRVAVEQVTALQDRLEAVTAERHELASALDQLKTALGTAIDSTLLAQQVVEKGRRK